MFKLKNELILLVCEPLKLKLIKITRFIISLNERRIVSYRRTYRRINLNDAFHITTEETTQVFLY